MHRGNIVRDLRALIRPIIESRETPAGRVFDWVIQSMILVSVVSYTIETMPERSEAFYAVLRSIEISLVAIFTCEYFVRLWVEKRPWKFIFSFYGLVDLISILPFYLTMGGDLRALRAIRMLKILRYSRAMNRFRLAFIEIRAELAVFGLASLLVIYLAAVGIYIFENPAQPEIFRSVFDGIWWAVATLTTVGYGDVYPITTGGKTFTFLVLAVGLGVVAVPSALLASSLSRVRDKD
ncbi:ion transporter [Zhongshania arctica]|uniref:Ion transporter n=1 Tax=Zhongshania arctica TaxID=3238302 RepID=A0ABV3TT54_9GAMM